MPPGRSLNNLKLDFANPPGKNDPEKDKGAS